MGYSILVRKNEGTGKFHGIIANGRFVNSPVIHKTEGFDTRPAAYQAAMNWKIAKANERKEAKSKVDAIRMHCQCCARPILANTGVIAHHGYERPDWGYQTASCYGARVQPFEVSRDELGSMIKMMRNRLERFQAYRSETAAEQHAIRDTWTTGRKPNIEHHSFDFTRANFDTDEAVAAKRALYIYHEFDEMLRRELASQDHQIKSLTNDIKEQQKRYDGWKQTHSHFDSIEGEWVKL